MESQRSSSDAGSENVDGTPEEPVVSVHETAPERVVFTEEGNADGWIATDITVERSR
jgi:hypothetical protein